MNYELFEKTYHPVRLSACHPSFRKEGSLWGNFSSEWWSGKAREKFAERT
jgi:hypothetical protein